MNAAVVDFKPSLRSAQHAFEQWRSSRTRRGPTPMALRHCAVALLEQHCAFHVCRALRINANALKQWSGTQPAPHSTSPECPVDAEHPAGFVRLPHVEKALVEPAPPITESLIIELPNKAVIHIHRAFTLDEVFQAAARVGGNTRAC
ncbi:hypothetical protein [Granulosicoccus antarcticus]|uniref:Uncharacterized protein n=1 Tax=Granulosicoccus antarcticus IMCC3135 TaxID=1192854 RepID=A0A2Z2NWP7_9GAMM|nr:hypothetical protein [Granulosicoccus antarcticus]ASJ70368.1 hypothetical protein IMCC3135_01245 [Granulosicoccus antarcticus IMCC3135]ASJ74586.1 hypothetical protein IMCC3135_22580 [Granulosicoccus antarcticus IMCC3135]ASJ75779.1 hypothetical protein IMCC3135_28635 [Granulosicoccus antarcticus IMCC3135]